MAGILPCGGTPSDCDRVGDKYAFNERPTSTTPPRPSPLSDNFDAQNNSEIDDEPEALFKLTLFLHNQPIELPFYDKSATIQDLSDTVAGDLHIPPTHQKFLITPKTGLLKPPFKDPTLPLHTLRDKKIVLMGATTAEVVDLQTSIAERKERLARRKVALAAGRKVKAYTHRDSNKLQDEARYTFHAIRPLPYLPNPDKSQRFLERLANDAGIKASMRKHGFSVGLLTEMNPDEHTSSNHEGTSRTLGLNRNRGEVIELRLRTDAHDGYRDYKVIRKTLCHELTHNVWGDHDRKFWDLCKEIEAEVARNDTRSGGHVVGGGAAEFYNPGDEGVSDEEADGGGWDGVEVRVGGGGGEVGLSRREVMAKAAEERMKREREARRNEEGADN